MNKKLIFAGLMLISPNIFGIDQIFNNDAISRNNYPFRVVSITPTSTTVPLSFIQKYCNQIMLLLHSIKNFIIQYGSKGISLLFKQKNNISGTIHEAIYPTLYTDNKNHNGENLSFTVSKPKNNPAVNDIDNSEETEDNTNAKNETNHPLKCQTILKDYNGKWDELTNNVTKNPDEDNDSIVDLKETEDTEINDSEKTEDVDSLKDINKLDDLVTTEDDVSEGSETDSTLKSNITHKDYNKIWEKIKHDIKIGVMNINATDQYGNTALVYATQQGNIKIAEWLIEHGANIYAKNHEKLTTIQIAHKYSHTDLKNFLNNQKAFINAFSKCEWESVKSMIQNGTAIINATDRYGNTALVYATQQDNIKIAEWLIEHGANIYAKNNKNLTALDIANQGNTPKLKHFLKNQAEFVTAFSKYNWKSVKHMIKNETAVINATDRYGNTALTSAVKLGLTNITNYLIRHGANIYAKNHEKLNAIDIANQSNHPDLKHFIKNQTTFVDAFSKCEWESVKHMINNETAIINTTDYHGNTALMYAIQEGNTKIIKWLLDHKINITMANDKQLTASMIARKYNRPNIADYLNEMEVIYAASHSKWTTLKKVLKNGANANAKDQNGNFALMFAINDNNIEIIRYLILYGADINAKNNKGNTALIYATRKGNIKIVQYLISHGADIDITNNQGLTAIMLANQHNRSEMTQYLREQEVIYAFSHHNWKTLINLLKNGANVNTKDKNGNTALIYAVKEGDVEVIRQLISYGADINAKNDKGQTAKTIAQNIENSQTRLTIAAYLNNQQNLSALSDNQWENLLKNSKKHITKHIRDKNNNTVLMCAAKKNDLETVKRFVELGTNIFIENNEGLTATIIAQNNHQLEVQNYLHNLELFADAFSHYKWEDMKKAIQKGANINIKDRLGYSALIYAVIKGNSNIVTWLIEHGINVNDTDIYGNTALMYAAQTGNLKIIKQLIQNGANIFAKNNKKLTSKTIAQKFNQLEVKSYLTDQESFVDAFSHSKWDIVKDMINKGTFINTSNKDLNTALIYAVQQGDLEIIKWLIQHGADVNAQNKKNYTALMYTISIISAINYKHNEITQKNHIKNYITIAKYLIQNSANVNLTLKKGISILMQAANHGILELTKELITNGANINQTDNKGRTALSYAYKHNNWDIVKYLIDKGADINAKYKLGRNIITILMKAVRDGDLEHTQYLIEHGADVNAQSSNKRTALMYASMNNNVSLLQQLVHNGANVDMTDQNKMTALMYAVQGENLNAVQYLIKKKANINAKNNNGYTPLMLATYAGYSNVVQYLTSLDPQSQHIAKRNITDNKKPNKQKKFKDPNQIDIKPKSILKQKASNTNATKAIKFSNVQIQFFNKDDQIAKSLILDD